MDGEKAGPVFLDLLSFFLGAVTEVTGGRSIALPDEEPIAPEDGCSPEDS
jgi:hypothetical protein